MFNTWPETDQHRPSLTNTVSNDNKKIIVSARTFAVRTGFHNLETCIKL
jgi:hypothetical protein